MEDKIRINNTFVRELRERRGELLDKINELDNQLDHVDGMIEQGKSNNVEEHYRLIREIEAANLALAATYQPTIEQPDPFGPQDGMQNAPDYDEYEDEQAMYEQLRRGEG